MKSSWRIFSFILLLAAMLPFTACQLLGQGEVKDEEVAVSAPPLPPPGMYLDFEDVQIPSGLRINREMSFVYESNDLKAGVMTLIGTPKVADVLAYFQDHMPKDNWQLLSKFKYHKNILLYSKPGKVCIIVVTQPASLTFLEVEVWVAPLKPGSDPFATSLSGTRDRDQAGAAAGSTLPFLSGKPKTGQFPLGQSPKSSGPLEETLRNVD